MTDSAVDSLKRRYVAKVGTNVIGMVIGLGTQAMVPRGLGPSAYGNFQFLFNFFNRIPRLIEMGSSFGFYAKLSQRPKDFGLVIFYSWFIFITWLIVAFFTGISLFTRAYPYLFPGQSAFYIFLGMILGLLSWSNDIIQTIVDAYGLTINGELLKLLEKLFNLSIVFCLFFLKKLNLTTLFITQYIVTFFLIAGFFLIIRKGGYLLNLRWTLGSAKIKEYISELYEYTHPLVIYTCVGLVITTSERWLLQKFGGSVEQGFFGLSSQIGQVCSLFTNAMIPLFMREFAISFEKKDFKEMKKLYLRYIPLLYAIASYFACFIAFQADKVTLLIGGHAFHQASVTVLIMAFLPLHETYGQLCSSFFLGAGQTRIYRNVGIVTMMAGFPVVFFLLAPSSYHGLGIGANGLAIKMVLSNIIYANVLNYLLCRTLKVSFLRSLGHQILCPAAMISLTLIAEHIGALWATSSMMGPFFLNGIVYTLLVALFVFLVPSLFGLTRSDLQILKDRILQKVAPSHEGRF